LPDRAPPSTSNLMPPPRQRDQAVNVEMLLQPARNRIQRIIERGRHNPPCEATPNRANNAARKGVAANRPWQ
jgi:hypothetical protein